MLKKLLVPLFGAFLAITAINGKRNITPSYALENSGNGFELIEKSYTASESFVYTAVANFENGQACGVVIGGADDSRYWVFNIDRFENKTKLLYFGRTGQEMEVTEVRNEWYMGNDKVTESELNVIKPKVAACPQYNFKVVVTIQESHAYAEFFIDNIKRFGVDNVIDLNHLILSIKNSTYACESSTVNTNLRLN